MPFSTPGMSLEKSSARRRDLMETFRRIIEIAKEESVDAVLICGDLYEHEYIRKSTIAFIGECVNEVPRIRFFIVPGNHDPYIPNSYYKIHKWPHNVTILAGDNPYAVLDELGACIYGVSFKSFIEKDSLINDISNTREGFINILMAHGTVDMSIGQSPYNPMPSQKLAGLGMDYVALGHFHNRIDNIGGYGKIFNPGSPEPLGFDEVGDHGVFVVTISNSEGVKFKLKSLSFPKPLISSLSICIAFLTLHHL